MGGTVGIEAARLEELDYETVKASGLAFGTAHNVLQRSLTKSKSVNVSNDQTTIHFLAIRQLSHNLKNQKVLEKSRKKVMKTKSVPHNVKYKQHSFERDLLFEADGDRDYEHDVEQELNKDDLDLVHDEEYYAHHDSFHAQLVDDGPPWNFSDKASFQSYAQHSDSVRVQEAFGADTNGIAAGNHVAPSTTPKIATPVKPKKARPNLSLQLTSDVSNHALPVDTTINGSNGTDFQPHKLAHVKRPHHHHIDGEQADVGAVNAAGQPLKHPPSPSANVRVSPRGTLYMGKWKVMETGIFPDESAQSLRKPHQHKGLSSHGSVGNNLDRSHTYARGMSSSSHIQHQHSSLGSSSSNLHRTGSLLNGSMRRPAALPAIGGKRDFLEINTLGSGASGVVTEAIHLPSLTIVALKMLPVYNQEKRQHVSRELGVLYKNLAELRLVDDSLYEDKKEEAPQTTTGTGPAAVGGLGGASSPHILSLYNAFVDPKSGMINLVIEYMDGGSLEDLVQQGGCRDEKVLADITYQTIKGLCFLHSHKSVHRDIKPANILCSTSGLIKIGDFGISKALDKTSGFANSFVGTVSYMSPERITGETYSFSSDIWSLGLTILAVAKGRFPLSSHDSGSDSGTHSESSSPLHQQVVGGAAGYWAMIKAICDDEPPVAGPFFSTEFNAFIAACLQKDPAGRSTAKGLLSQDFLVTNAGSLKLSFSDLQMRRSSVSPDRTIPTPGGARESPDKLVEKGASPVKLEVDTTSFNEPPLVPSAPSPLTTRLTNAAIVRRTSLEVPVFDSPTNLMHKAITEAEQKAALDSNSSRDANLGSNGNLVHATIREDVEEEDVQFIDGAQRALDVINSIRLEHLDRVLDRIAHKLGKRARRPHSHSVDGEGGGGGGGGGESGAGAHGEEGEEEEDDDDDFDDTQDRDLTDIHHYDHDFAAAKDDPLLVEHSSVDSMDKLLQYKGGSGEPSPPPTLQLPAHKFQAKRVADAAPEVDEVADLKPALFSADAKGATGHKAAKSISSGDTAVLRKEGIVRLVDPPGDEKSSMHHSILKGTASYNASHGHASLVPLHAVVNSVQLDGPLSFEDGLMKADEKKAIFVSHKTRSIGTTAFSSNRSVHFTEDDESGIRKSTLAHHRPSLVVEGEGAEEREGDENTTAASHPHLPKTSSYFVQSRSHQPGDAETKVGEGEEKDEKDAMGVVDHAIAISEAVSQASLNAPPSDPIDYRRMLPKLNSRGLPKWENLARQLHLPLHLVKLAVRSRLGDLLNLEDEEDEEGEEGEEEERCEGCGGGGGGGDSGSPLGHPSSSITRNNNHTHK